MSACHVQASATIELYFYGELTGPERDAVERHLAGCAECRATLEELGIIRAALRSRPAVDAPPGGDWSGFMRRLDGAVRTAPPDPAAFASTTASTRRFRLAPMLAMAAVLTLATAGVLVVVSDRTDRAAGGAGEPAAAVELDRPDAAATVPSPARDPGLASMSDQHFERSKLVVLGLATRNPEDGAIDDWTYERRLATTLLNDTRLYRRAAEDRGMTALADVMRDLEIVLLQASMSEEPDREALAQIQRLIRRRDLIAKMEVVSTTGLAP